MRRDLWLSKGTYLACIVIMSIGLMTFNLFSIGYDNFSVSKDEYYKNQNFAEGFAQVSGMPDADLAKLENLPEIKQVDGRLVKDVRVIDSENESNVYLRLISYQPDDGAQLNQFELQSGSLPSENSNTVVVDSKFYEATSQFVGNQLQIAAEGRVVDLTVVGSGRTPEYIYALRTDQEIYPDPERFGIAFIPYETMKTIFKTGQTVNDIAFTLNPNISYKDAEHAMTQSLESYGLIKIVPRKDQKSNMLLTSEIDGMKGMATAMPVVFLGVAAMILIIMLKRLVEKQRGQIGVLKAFGLTDREILIHYLGYAVVIGIAGGIVGGLIGNVMVAPFTGLYQTMFNMPLGQAAFSLKYFTQGIGLSLLFSLIAGYRGAKSSLRMEPAEAMRPPAPKSGGATVIERITVIWKRLSMINRIAVRNIFRNKGRSFFVLIGIVLTFSVLGMPWTMSDSMNEMIYGQFENVLTYDMKMDLSQPVLKRAALAEVYQEAGVEHAEALLEVPATIYNNSKKKDVLLLGIEKDSELYKLQDEKGMRYELPSEGVVLSERLAQVLNVKAGDVVLIKSPFNKDPDGNIAVRVTKVIPQYLGLNAYMDETALKKALNQSEFTTSIIAKASPEAIENISDAYRDSSTVFGVNSQSELIGKYAEMMEMMISMVGIFVFIGLLSGFSIVYASSMITVSERHKELASMLVIGMSHSEVKRVLVLEQWYVAFAGIILGIPMLKLMVVGMAQMMNNDVYTMPTSVSWKAGVSALVLTMIAIVIAQYILGKKVEKLQLVEALSIRE